MACKSCRVLNNALLRMQYKCDKRQADLRELVEEVENDGNYYDGNDADDDLDRAYGKGMKEAAKRFKQLLEEPGEELSDTTR